MQAGKPSRTAVFVCSARALAHAAGVAGFSDPTALKLLPDEDRARVERVIRGDKPRNMKEGFMQRTMQVRSRMMVVRTMAIDAVVRAGPVPQLVILGAGLDGRAWRMAELNGATVFEVDHPDTQRDKRARVAGLAQTAREVRFVPVDFTRDRLDEALAAAGHDAARPTVWIWEGVVMYLTPAEVEATLTVIAARSAADSRLVVVYHSPAWILKLIDFGILRRVGEPLRSAFKPDAMRALLAKHGFEVDSDDDVATLGQRMSADVGEGTRVLKHMRIVAAHR